MNRRVDQGDSSYAPIAGGSTGNAIDSVSRLTGRPGTGNIDLSLYGGILNRGISASAGLDSAVQNRRPDAVRRWLREKVLRQQSSQQGGMLMSPHNCYQIIIIICFVAAKTTNCSRREGARWGRCRIISNNSCCYNRHNSN